METNNRSVMLLGSFNYINKKFCQFLTLFSDLITLSIKSFPFLFIDFSETSLISVTRYIGSLITELLENSAMKF